MQIKLVTLDLDGTILGSPPVISPAVMQAIRQVQARGIQVTVVTGRMYRAAVAFHQELKSDLPLISYQGALIKDPQNDKVYWHKPVSLDLAQSVIEVFRHYDLPFHVYLNDTLYVEEPVSLQTEIYRERTGIEPVVVNDINMILTAAPTKLLGFWGDNHDEIWADLQERYDPQELYLTRSTTNFVEAVNPQSTKGHAVQYLAETVLGLAPANVLAIGDYYNDLEMLAYAGIGVAMGSAPPAVQAVANWVAPTVEEDGVAAALHKFILNQ